MPEDIVVRIPMILMIPPEEPVEPPIEDIVVRIPMILMIPEGEPPPDGVIPPDWQEWLEENWEVIAAVIVAAVILVIILTRGE